MSGSPVGAVVVPMRVRQRAWQLVLDHQDDIDRFARVLARRFRPRTYKSSVEDAEQCARMAAFWAAVRYDPARRTKFMTLARYWIWLYVRRALVGTGLAGDVDSRVVSVVVPLDDTLEDELAGDLDPLDPLILRERDRLVREVMARMPPQMQVVATRCLFQDQTYNEVGLDLGVSKEWVRRIRNRAINRIRWELWERGIVESPPESDVARTG